MTTKIKRKKLLISIILTISLFILLLLLENRMNHVGNTRQIVIAKENLNKDLVLTKENIYEYLEYKKIPETYGIVSSKENIEEYIGCQMGFNLSKGYPISGEFVNESLDEIEMEELFDYII